MRERWAGGLHWPQVKIELRAQTDGRLSVVAWAQRSGPGLAGTSSQLSQGRSEE